ncbi:MAG: hypothetical protein ACPGN3_14475 [Opitutales bacterium]
MRKLADTLFLMNAVYFIFMATAHFFSIKVPVLFIYYDVPFYAYQDRIISFAVCAYVILFIQAFRLPQLRSSAIVLMYLTCLGLSSVNVSGDLKNLLAEGQTTAPYWIQTFAILALTLVMHGVHARSGVVAKGKLREP